ncbi:hypothetical protein C7E13_18715, partial [Stenotrophomonas maltophilia]
VVFSDWMTGYGMILIVDHGNGYMSLYAHNDTLLHGHGRGRWHRGVLRLDDRLRHDPDRRPRQRLHEPLRA